MAPLLALNTLLLLPMRVATTQSNLDTQPEVYTIFSFVLVSANPFPVDARTKQKTHFGFDLSLSHPATRGPLDFYAPLFFLPQPTSFLDDGDHSW